MIQHSKISLNKFILSLSEAIDYVCPEIDDHQQRVTYIAMSMAQEMGLGKRDLSDIFLAAALHDIGIIHVENRIRFLRQEDLECVGWHGETGYELLRSNELFDQAAWIVRFHHIDWAYGRGVECNGQAVPLASHIIHLADCIELAIDRNTQILEQSASLTDQISKDNEIRFHPECIHAFQALAQTEAFWLDCVSHNIDVLLTQGLNDNLGTATHKMIRGMATILARVVDAMSPWTATHSAGVAATAVALADQMGFSPREQNQMRIAGLLHDLGKLTVPSRILNDPGKSSPQDWAVIKGHTYHTYRILENIGFSHQIAEWAAYHHERMDGKGYPFHHKGEDLTLGSRIMAVADVFTALSENRPYRKGLPLEDAMSTLDQMAKHGALDKNVVAVLQTNREFINNIRKREQSRYAEQQEILAEIMMREKILV
jgi:putative nucleotidyltransferase with HDIG domain